jgi:hypothetical protein
LVRRFLPLLSTSIAALAAAIIVGGCFRAGYDAQAATCVTSSDCVGGDVCVEGVCATTGPGTDHDAGPDPVDADPSAPDADPAAPDAAPPPPDATVVPPPPTPCGSMQLLRDDFNDGTAGAQWVPTAESGVTLSEASDYLSIRLGAGGAGVEGVYRSRNSYDLASSELSVEVLGVGGEITAIEVRDFDDRGAAMGVEGTQLIALTVDGLTEATRAGVRYDPAQHHFWRLREASGVMFWETSPDRSTWSTLHSQVVTMTGTYAYAYLLAWGQLSSVSEARFDNVNLPAATVPGFCPASSVVDTFDDGQLPGTWNAWVGSGSCTTRESGGTVLLSFNGIGESFCGLETDQLLDARNDAVQVEVISSIQSPNAVTFVELVSPDHSQKVEFRQSDGVLYMAMTTDGNFAVVASIFYDPVAHRHWRIRNASGRTFWETSPTGTAWTARVSVPTTADLSAVILDLAAGHNPGTGSAFTVRFDRLNAP